MHKFKFQFAVPTALLMASLLMVGCQQAPPSNTVVHTPAPTSSTEKTTTDTETKTKTPAIVDADGTPVTSDTETTTKKSTTTEKKKP